MYEEGDKEFLFIKAARDGFLFQHIDQPTRGRGEDKPSLLDLIFTIEKGMISDLEIRNLNDQGTDLKENFPGG